MICTPAWYKEEELNLYIKKLPNEEIEEEND